MPIKPKTDRSPENVEAMKAETKRLLESFGGPSGLSMLCREHYQGTEHEGKFKRITVGQWGSRGRVSAEAAVLLEGIPLVSCSGFTRRSLRPDVDWGDQ